MSAEDPHASQPVETAGPDPADAAAAVVLAHGRGARARGMLGLAEEFGVDDVAYLAPQAARGTWYPDRFLAPVENNEPWLSSAKELFGSVVGRAVDAGIPHERLVLGGFSQGACLATTWAAEHPRRYGGVFAFSGGLIGPEGTDFEYEGDLDGTPMFLGVSDDDPHIPLSRARETTAAFRELGADVEEQIYEGRGHGIFPEETEYVGGIVADAAGR
jgi:phospholipase/carboxylesterase